MIPPSSVFLIALVKLKRPRELIHRLRKCWTPIDQTVDEGIKELTQLCADEVLIDGQIRMNKIPEPRPSSKILLERAHVKMPTAIRSKGIRVATRAKLAGRRKST